MIESPFGKANWYPHDKETLISDLKGYLQNGPNYESHQIQAIICPHAGYKYCGSVIGHAMSAIKDQNINHIIILGPSHKTYLKEQFITPDIIPFKTECGSSNINNEFIQSLEKIGGHQRNQKLFESEHSIWMMLPFIHLLHPNTSISPIIIGDISRQQSQAIANQISQFSSNDTLIVISTDFTHYGYQFDYVPFTANIPNEIAAIDNKAFQFIATKDSDGFWDWYHSVKTTICGRHSISVLLDYMNNNHHVMNKSYLQSGQLTNDWSHSVSYKSAIIGVEML